MLGSFHSSKWRCIGALQFNLFPSVPKPRKSTHIKIAPNNPTTNRSKFIQNGKTGIVLSLNQLKYLSDVIVDLLKNEEKRELFGKNAKEFADKNLWNWEERIDIEIREVKKLLKPS